MGWLGKLFGKKGPRRPPGWAREIFTDDGARFDAFVDAVLGELAAAGTPVSEMDVRTGTVVLPAGEWMLESAAYECVQVPEADWPKVVRRNMPGAAAEPGDDEADEADEPDAATGGEGKSWIIGAAPWGVVFECGPQAMVLVLLPTVEPVTVPALPEKLVRRVIVCNGGEEGHLAGTAIARAAGLAHVFATHPERPIDRGAPVTAKAVEVRALEAVTEGALVVTRRGAGVHGTWSDGVTFLAGDALPMSLLVETAPSYAVGKLVVDAFDPGKLVDVILKIKKVLIVANTPGVDARALGQMLAQLGISADILDADPNHRPDVPRMSEVLGHIVLGDLDRADAIAVEAIAAGDRPADMQFQRAIIALMRGDDAAAEAHLALLDTPQALSSRAILAAKRGDPMATDLAKRAVAGLPEDAIAIRAAVSVHAIAGDPAGAREILAAHGAHLDPDLRDALDAAIDDPDALRQSMVHRFPEHAALVLDAVAPMVSAGEYAAAEALLRRATTWDPDNLGVTAELGITLSRQSQDEEALAVYDAAIERGGANHLLRFNRANCLLRRRSFTQAVVDFRACLAVKPDWHDARVNLTSALFASGDVKAAKAEVAQLEKLGGPPQHIAALRQMLAGAL